MLLWTNSLNCTADRIVTWKYIKAHLCTARYLYKKPRQVGICYVIIYNSYSIQRHNRKFNQHRSWWACTVLNCLLEASRLNVHRCGQTTTLTAGLPQFTFHSKLSDLFETRFCFRKYNSSLLFVLRRYLFVLLYIIIVTAIITTFITETTDRPTWTIKRQNPARLYPSTSLNQ